MDSTLPLAVITVFIGIVAAARASANRIGLRARRQFLHSDSAVALEGTDGYQFGLYFKQLLRERGYLDIRVVKGAFVQVLASSPTGRAVSFQWVPNASDLSGKLAEATAVSTAGRDRVGDRLLVTTATVERDQADLAAGRDVIVIDRPIIDAWIAEARGTAIVEMLSAEMPAVRADGVVLPPEIVRLVREGQKLQAINLYRQLNPAARLTEATDVILWLSAAESGSREPSTDVL